MSSGRSAGAPGCTDVVLGDVVQRKWCGVAGHEREAGRKVLLQRNVVTIVWMWAQG